MKILNNLVTEFRKGEYRQQYKYVGVGIGLFGLLLIYQLFFHTPPTPASAFVIDETTPEQRIFSMVRRPKDMVKPIPSGNPTPLPTFTPTPTPTNTPTPTPTPTNTPTPTPTPTVYIPPPAPADLDNYFKKYSSEFSADETTLRKIAVCESGYNTSSHNEKYDYAGMYQFSKETWTLTRSQMGADTNPDLRFHAEEAIKTAAFKIAHGGGGAWSQCSK